MREAPRQPWWCRRAVLAGVALTLVTGSIPLAAQTFDRFFTTASERLLLDQARQEFTDPVPMAPPPVVDEVNVDDRPRGPVVPQITISGVVIRARGQDTSWINGSGIRPDEITPEGIRVQPQRGAEARVQIVLPESAEPISLRPGQKIDLATGTVLEAYQRDVPTDGRSVFKPSGDARPAAAPRLDGDSNSVPESASSSGG